MFLRENNRNFTTINEEMDKIINLELNLKNIHQTINFKILKNILIRMIVKCELFKFNKFKANLWE